MKKKVLFLIFLVTTVILTFFFSVESDLLKNKIEQTVRKTPYKVTFRSAKFRLPLRIVLKDLVVEDENLTITLARATLSVSPIKLLLRKPSVYLSLNSPTIKIKKIPRLDTTATDLSFPIRKIAINNGRLSYGAVLVNNIEGDLNFDGLQDNQRERRRHFMLGISGIIKGSVKSSKIVCLIKTSQKESEVNIDISDINLLEYIPVSFSVDGNPSLVGEISIKNRISESSVNSLIDGSFGGVNFKGEGSYSREGYTMAIDWKKPGVFGEGRLSITGRGVEASFSITSEESYILGDVFWGSGGWVVKVTTSSVKIPTIDGIFSLKLDGDLKPGSYKLISRLSGDVKTDRNYRVESDFLLSNGDVVFKGGVTPGNSKFKISVKNFKEVEGVIVGDRKSRIHISGGGSPLKVVVRSDNWNVESIPFVRFPFKCAVVMDGEFFFDRKEWLFKSRYRLKDILWNGIKLGDVTAKVVLSRSMFSISEFDYLSGRIIGEYKNMYKIKREVNLKATDAPLEPLSGVFSKKISGTLSGVVKISEQAGRLNGIVKTNLQDFRIENSRVGDVNILANFTQGGIFVEKLSLINRFGKVAGGVSVIDQRVSGVLNFDRYSLDGDIFLLGQVIPSGKFYDLNHFDIDFNSESFSVGRFFEGLPLRVSVVSDDKSLRIDTLEFGNFKDNYLSVAKSTPNKIEGTFNLKDFTLSKIDSKLKGRFSILSKVSGTLSNPVIEASYTIKDFSHKDIFSSGSVEGKFRYENDSGRIYDTKWILAGGEINLRGTLGRVARSLVADVHITDLSKVIPEQRFIQSGELSSVITLKDVSKSFLRPQITAIGEMKNLSMSGQMFNKVAFDIKFEKGDIYLDELTVQKDGNEVSLAKESIIDLTKKNFNLKLLVKNFRYGIISILGRLSLKGEYQTRPLRLSGELTLDDLWLGEKRFSGEAFKFTLTERNLFIRSLTDLPRFFVEARFDAKSLKADYTGSRKDTLLLSGRYEPSDLSMSLKATALDAETLIDLFNLPISLSGSTDIDALVTGRIRAPNLEASAIVKNGCVADIPFSEVICKLTLRKNLLSISEFSITHRDIYKLVANGYMPVVFDKKSARDVANIPNNLTVTIEYGELKFLEGVTVFKKARGPVSGKLELKGTHSSPKVAGFLRVKDAYLELKSYIEKINDFNLIAKIKDNELIIEDLSGRVGAGRFLLKGTTLFKNFKPSRMNFTFENTTTAGVDLSIPELPIPSPFSKETGIKFASSYSYGKPRFKMSLTGDAQKKVVLSGWITLDNTYFSYPPPPSTRSEDPLKEVLGRIELDLQLRAGENTWYENELVSINVDGALNIKGNWYKPSVNGVIESKRGYISYLGTEFKIRKARLEVINDEAYLEGVAFKSIPAKQGYDTVEVIINKAPIGKIQPRFVLLENPQLASENVLARVVCIDAMGNTPEERDLLLRQGLIRLLDSSLATPLAKNLLRRSGVVDLMKVSYVQPSISESRKETTTTLPELLKGTKYTFEKYLTDDMLVAYGITLDEQLGKLDLKHEIEVAYRWRGNIFIRGIYELESISLLRPPERKVAVESHWRFGWPHKKK